MNIFVILALAVLLIVVLLRFRTPIGPAILAGGLLVWAICDRTFPSLSEAAVAAATSRRSYDLLFALYFVMCLEIQLRRSGTLTGMVEAFNRIFRSTRVTLSAMPAFLGLLPSVGGARFSAPIVAEASRGATISSESKAAINFWFRHVCEFMSPIIPGMILACAICQISVADLVMHLVWLSVVAFAIGWLVLLRPLKFVDKRALEHVEPTPELLRKNAFDITLAFGPVLVNVVLMMAFDVPASIAMGLVVVGMIPVLMAAKRPVGVREVFGGACDWRLIFNVICILYFIEILTATGVLDQVIGAFRTSPLPEPVAIAMASFVIGVLTGISQGHVAVVMPIVAGLAPGSLEMAGVALVFGVAGQMVTPTHVCLMLSIDYFKADFFKTLAPIIVMEVMLLTVFSVVTWFLWA